MYQQWYVYLCRRKANKISVIDENDLTPTAFTGEYLPDSHTSKGPGPGDLLAFLQKRREKKAARGRAA